MSHADTRAGDVDVTTAQTDRLAPTKASVGTHENQRGVPCRHRLDQLLDLDPGQEARRFLPLGGKRNLKSRVHGQAAIGDRRTQTLTKRKDRLANSRRGKTSSQQLRDPDTDVAVADSVERKAAESGEDLTSHRRFQARPRRGPQIMPSRQPHSHPFAELDFATTRITPD